MTPVAPLQRTSVVVRRVRQKKVLLSLEKKIAFHLRVLHYHFRPCSIQAISIKMLERNGILRPKKVGRNVYCYYNEE